MSARTRRKLVKKRVNKKERNSKLFRYTLYFLALIVFLAVLFIFNLQTDKKDKIAIGYFRDEDVAILVFDPVAESMTRIIIPSDLQFDVSHNLGHIKTKNLGKIAINEKLGSKLLSKTLTKNLKVPVLYHSSENLDYYLDESLVHTLRELLFIRDTNLNIAKRIQLAFFASGVLNTKRADLNLKDFSFVSYTELTDGSMGYVITKDTSPLFVSLVSDSVIQSKGYTLRIINRSGQKSLIRAVTLLVRNSGLSMTEIEEGGTQNNLGCLLVTENKELIKYLLQVIDCDTRISTTQTDVELILGRDFTNVF